MIHRLQGVDFTSAPRRGKAITAATLAPIADNAFALQALESFADWQGFEGFLVRPGPSITAFDFPFGLPRPLVEVLDWPRAWLASMHAYAALDRATIRDHFRAYCDARPAGAKFAHRATDGPAGSSPSMKWVNPPVAWMLHAGVPRLIDARLSIPALHDDPRQVDTNRVALEGYPGFVARAITRASYKSDTRALQTDARRDARECIVRALEAGSHRWPIRLVFGADDRAALIADGSADPLDAVLCAVQAAWAWQQHRDGHSRFGLPADVDPLEGWIVGVPA